VIAWAELHWPGPRTTRTAGRQTGVVRVVLGPTQCITPETRPRPGHLTGHSPTYRERATTGGRGLPISENWYPRGAFGSHAPPCAHKPSQIPNQRRDP